MRIAATDALANLRHEGERARYPGRTSPRYEAPLLFPELRPSFTFPPSAKIFTIGSCFARNIEEHLTGFELPTLGYGVPKSEWGGGRRNGIINEYNPGTIAQRIERAMRGEEAPPDTIVSDGYGLTLDLLLQGYPVTYERAVERRREIDAIYAELPTADVVVITLGLIEGWFDTELGTYLNRIPPGRARETGRYELVIMDVAQACALLEPALRLLAGKRILLSVSPVPFTATFSGEDVIVANSLSKAVLRAAAHALAQLPGVDYFPSYEIVMSGGTSSFEADNIHVLDEVVGRVVEHMLRAYVEQ